MNSRILRPAIAALVVAALAFGSSARPARADSTSTLLITAAAVAALATAVNVSEKNAKAHQVVGYLQNGSVVYADGHVVAQNGQSWYPGNYGQSIACNGMQCVIQAGAVGYNGYNGNPYQNGINGSYPPGYGSYPPGYGSYPPGYGSYPPGYGSYPPGYGSYPPGYGSYPPGYGSYPPGGYGSYPPGYGGTPYAPGPITVRTTPVDPTPYRITAPVHNRHLNPVGYTTNPVRYKTNPVRHNTHPVSLSPGWKRFGSERSARPPHYAATTPIR